MGLVKLASAANAAVEADVPEGNEYTVILNVNGTAPSGSTATISAKALGANFFEELVENSDVDLTAPSTVRISYPGGAHAELSAIKVVPNATFTADPTSTIDVLVNVVNVDGRS